MMIFPEACCVLEGVAIGACGICFPYNYFFLHTSGIGILVGHIIALTHAFLRGYPVLRGCIAVFLKADSIAEYYFQRLIARFEVIVKYSMKNARIIALLGLACLMLMVAACINRSTITPEPPDADAKS